MIETPKIIYVPAQLIAIIPIAVARDKIQTVMGPGLHELVEHLKAQGIAPTGPWFTHQLSRLRISNAWARVVPQAKKLRCGQASHLR